MGAKYVISVMAADRIGIVADVATAIRTLQGNLADLSQTVLQDYFTMILVAEFPEGVKEDTVRDAIHRVQGDTPFCIGIQPWKGSGDKGPKPSSDNHYVLTATGADRIGLVAAVAEYCRHKQINIADLATIVANGTYTMLLLLDILPGTDLTKLKRSLGIAMTDIGITVELQHHSIFKATNEI